MQALLFGHLATFVLSGFRYVAQIFFYLSLAVFSLSLTILFLLFTDIPFLFPITGGTEEACEERKDARQRNITSLP